MLVNMNASKQIVKLFCDSPQATPRIGILLRTSHFLTLAHTLLETARTLTLFHIVTLAGGSPRVGPR